MIRRLYSPGMSKCILCYTCMISCARLNYKSHSVTRCALNIRTAGGMSGKYVADICRSCVKPTCASVCPTEALTPKKGGGAKLAKDKCIGCKKCIDACKIKYLKFDDDIKIPLMCTQCGICVKFCPHGCLAVTVEKEVSE